MPVLSFPTNIPFRESLIKLASYILSFPRVPRDHTGDAIGAVVGESCSVCEDTDQFARDMDVLSWNKKNRNHKKVVDVVILDLIKTKINSSVFRAGTQKSTHIVIQVTRKHFNFEADASE